MTPIAIHARAAALAAAAWELAERQHWVITYAQLIELGFSADAIRHRVQTGRLHRLYRGVYAVGRRDLTREGRWMAAILAAGPGALLSHESSAACTRLRDRERGIELAIPRSRLCRLDGLIVHRRHPGVFVGAQWVDDIPVTGPARTIIDLAARTRSRREVEALISDADGLDLIDPESLRRELERFKGEPGAPLVREVLDRATLVLTDSELERMFLPIARTAGLSTPQTQVQLPGGRVDFFWPDLGLVVEADSLRYHRTATQQTHDRRRDNAHIAAGHTPLRFTHAQIRYEPSYVASVLATTARRLTGDA